MLTSLYDRLHALLERSGFTAYPQDAVPAAAALPLVTCLIDPPATYAGAGSITLTLWTTPDIPHAERLLMADRLLQCVPPGGRLLPLPGGIAAVFRPDERLLSFPEKRGAMGVRIRLALRLAHK